MSLIGMLASAQGGAFFKNAGSSAGVSETDARTAISAMAPAIASKLKDKAAADPDAFDALLDLLEEGGDASDLDDIEAITGVEAISDGKQILADLYGTDGATALHAPGVAGEAKNKLAAISATSVLAALAASQPQQVASDGGNGSATAAAAGSGLLATIMAAIFKGFLQGASRQLAPRRRRRRRYSYGYGSRPRRRRARRPGLDQIFDAILKNR